MNGQGTSLRIIIDRRSLPGIIRWRMSSRRKQAGQKQANRNSLVELCRSITKLRHELAPREWATEEY